MKKQNIIYAVIAGIVVLGVILYFSLRHTDSDGHDHAKDENAATEAPHSEEEEKNAGGDKEVELNEAQYISSDIELGTFSQNNLSEVISANGYTELPPQNKADVSVFMSGIVKSINVNEGQNVKKGQVLAIIESPEFARLQEE